MNLLEGLLIHLVLPLIILFLLFLAGCTNLSTCEDRGGTKVHVASHMQTSCMGKDKFGHDVRVIDVKGNACPPRKVYACWTQEQVDQHNCRGQYCWNKPIDYDKTLEEILNQ